MTTAEAPTLRSEMDRRRARGERFTMKQTVALMVPLITSVAEAHAAGGNFILSPQAIRFHASGGTLDLELAGVMPDAARDHACVAPELRGTDALGGPRASVFSVGAILYELVTILSVGPGMRRPGELVPTLPDAFEALLAKALVSDPAHRPSDLAALAQALHHCAPSASMLPPEADESHLDHDGDVDVDVSLSMLPPAPEDYAKKRQAQREALASEGLLVSSTRIELPPDLQVTSSRRKGATSVLAEMKERLESDPRPRYVVLKDGMDHGPFSAVELLKQIVLGNFTATHVLRDTLSHDEHAIGEWHEFAMFAEHAKRGQDHEKEQAHLVASVAADATRSQYKTLVALGLSVVALAGLAGAYYRFGRGGGDELGVTGDRAQAVDVEGGLEKGKAKSGGGTWRGGPGRGPGGDGAPEGAAAQPSGGYPTVPDGLSCAGAQARYVEDYSKDAPTDLTQGAYASVLSRGTYLNSCGVPPSMGVSVCAAVQNGRAVGVTVTTNPPNGGIAKCVSGQVRSMSFPAHPRLDVATTSFAAQ